MQKTGHYETVNSAYGYGQSPLEAKADLCNYLERLGVTEIKVLDKESPLQISELKPKMRHFSFADFGVEN